MEGYLDIDLNSLETVCIKKLRGIYFLYRGKEIVYIGQTTNMIGRLVDHISNKTKEFDSYKLLEINGTIELDPIELEFIKKYKPIYNIHLNSDKPYKKRKSTKAFSYNILES